MSTINTKPMVRRPLVPAKQEEQREAPETPDLYEALKRGDSFNLEYCEVRIPERLRYSCYRQLNHAHFDRSLSLDLVHQWLTEYVEAVQYIDKLRTSTEVYNKWNSQRIKLDIIVEGMDKDKGE